MGSKVRMGIINFDLEDGELIDFPWHEEKEPPPVVKGKVKRKEEKKKDQEEEKKNGYLFFKKYFYGDSHFGCFSNCSRYYRNDNL